MERKIIDESGVHIFELDRIYKQFHLGHDTRENEMLKNIYKYSKNYQFKNAVFLIGYAHRDSLRLKIKSFEQKESLELNWRFFGDKSHNSKFQNCFESIRNYFSS